MFGIVLCVAGIAIIVSGAVWWAMCAKKEKAEKGDGWSHGEDWGARKKMGLFGLLGIVLIVPSLLYFQDPGEVAVIRNLGGSLSGASSEAGIHVKAPWQSIVKYDVRNNTISFIGWSEEDYTGGKALGPEITVNDKGGASAQMDVQVQYSLDPEVALELYAKYGGQDDFVRQVVAAGTRSISRDVAGKIDTIDILTSRGAFSQALKEKLTDAWSDDGVVVENVSVQDIRYPDSIKDKYAEAQSAEIAKQKAENEQQAAKVEAETKRIKAEGEAKANKELEKSLTDKVLTSRYIDALKDLGEKGNVVVVPEGSTPFVNTGKE